MAWFYADSSVLVKRHLPELGSTWFRALSAPSSHNRIITARLSLVEVISAFNRRVREGTLTPTDYVTARADFPSRYQRNYQIVPITNSLLERSCLLLERHPLRAYDALQLASAMAVHDTILSTVQLSLTFLALEAGVVRYERATYNC